ncbi:MAG: hypothetical protein AB7H71_18905 [Alphaproteobacteria bacterium]
MLPNVAAPPPENRAAADRGNRFRGIAVGDGCRMATRQGKFFPKPRRGVFFLVIERPLT